ncbi:RadC-like JAB domain-containing protein [Psychrobacillus sp. OK028]|nr:RadC-like JAB domain-containing protein [Psychrobacillus sp. OK028]
MCLYVKNQPTAINVCHIGSLDASILHPREVMKTAIMSNSASIIVAHNQPIGRTEPSQEDIEVTKRLVEAGKIIGIELIEHLLIGDDNHQYISLFLAHVLHSSGEKISASLSFLVVN